MTRPGRALRTHAPTASAVLLLTVALAVVPAGVRASNGSEYYSDPFLASWGPVRPIGDLATGSLGVVERTWWRRPLLLAWFRFNELPFPAEAADAFTYRELGAIVDPRKSVAAWRDAAKTAAPDLEPAGKPGADADLPGTTWGGFENCPADSWEQARRTLLARSEVWGAGSTALRNWIVAQHQVFARCRLGPEFFRKDASGGGSHRRRRPCRTCRCPSCRLARRGCCSRTAITSAPARCSTRGTTPTRNEPFVRLPVTVSRRGGRGDRTLPCGRTFANSRSSRAPCLRRTG